MYWTDLDFKNAVEFINCQLLLPVKSDQLSFNLLYHLLLFRIRFTGRELKKLHTCYIRAHISHLMI